MMIKGRLSNRKTTGSNQSLIDESYTYDFLDNLTSKKNTANGTVEMGGNLEEQYTYDILERMQTATGNWSNLDQEQSYNSFFDYDDLNNLMMKSQDHLVNGKPQVLSSRFLDYEYDHPDQPTRPSSVGGRTFTYDANGNLLLTNSQAIFNFDQNFFDEENRLLGHSNNGYISRYTYDGFGIRTIKSHGESQGVFVNGAPSGYVEHKQNYQVEVSPYFTVYSNDYRKHYFIDENRILTKIGTGLFQTNLGRGPELTAGGIDYKSRIQQYEQSILEYYASLGVPPGPPTLLALLGQPEINTTSLPDANNTNPYNTPPANWPNIPPPDTLGPPGPPVFYDVESFTRENVKAGYNFSLGNLTQELEQFYYHYDQMGSVYYVTDFAGYPRQYATYFPSGERWIYQYTSRDESAYFYTGLQYDEETELYDLGDIYYDPITSLELSLDPVLQNFGQSTFLNRPEGNFYYDYFNRDTDDQSDFDLEILNSERPDPFLAGAINVITSETADKNQKVFLTGGDLTEALGTNEPNWSVSSGDVKEKLRFTKKIKELVPDINELTIQQGGAIDLNDKDQLNALAKIYVQRKVKERLQRFKNNFKKRRVKRKVRFKD